MLRALIVTHGCPSENALAAHDAGQAWEGKLDLLAHLDGCLACQTIAAALVENRSEIYAASALAEKEPS